MYILNFRINFFEISERYSVEEVWSCFDAQEFYCAKAKTRASIRTINLDDNLMTLLKDKKIIIKEFYAHSKIFNTFYESYFRDVSMLEKKIEKLKNEEKVLINILLINRILNFIEGRFTFYANYHDDRCRSSYSNFLDSAW